MDPYDLTINQLKRAASIKEQIAKLSRELRDILGNARGSAAASRKKRTMSESAKRKIAAAQRRRWAKLRRATRTGTAAKSARRARKKL